MVKVNFSTLSEDIIALYRKFSDKKSFIPVYSENDHIYFWVLNDEGAKKADYLGIKLNKISVVERKNKDAILKAMEGIYSFLEEDSALDEKNEELLIDEDNILESSYSDAPIVQLVNKTIINAVKQRASDIHFEGKKDKFNIRFRIDGILTEYHKYNKKIQESVISRIKVMAGVDVAESRRPQDGVIRVNIGAKTIDIRVSVIPTVSGEKAVLRILDANQDMLSLSDVGLDSESLKLFRDKLSYPNGIILVTGPTGSGKTTTLYAAIRDIATVKKNILTIEDPIEYRMDGVAQVQVNPKIGLTFDKALKYFLRQDPDIIFVGEIRDVETAKAAISASLTGHLVLSTLHTNDASTTLARLIDMGVEPFLLASSILMVIGQRLVRRNCPHCLTDVEVDYETADIIKQYGMDIDRYKKGAGCKYCRDSGVSGRIGIFEIMDMTEDIKKKIMKRADAKEIEKAAVIGGMKTILANGIKKVKAGVTIPEEIILATRL
ncbi:MAG: general secretion pathway protein GspE [bacterium]|nr:MAG: general secretion pathway protein GspE [bacterium]